MASKKTTPQPRNRYTARAKDLKILGHVEAASAETQVRQDLEFLGTIHGLPPVQLGAYLGQVGSDATQLRETLGDLEQNLRSPTS